MLHGQTVRNDAAIVRGSRFGACVSGKNDPLIPIDRLSYHTARRLRWSSLRASRTGPPHYGKKSDNIPAQSSRQKPPPRRSRRHQNVKTASATLGDRKGENRVAGGILR